MTLTQRMKTMEVGKILVLFLCHIIFLSNAIVLPNFYPFGVSEGDQLVPTNDDGSSGTIPISIQFPFYDRNHNSLFVSMIIVFYCKNLNMFLLDTGTLKTGHLSMQTLL